MGCKPRDQVGLAEAKAHLLSVASEHRIASWVNRNPKESALAAFLAGFLMGGSSKLGRALKDSATLLLKLI